MIPSSPLGERQFRLLELHPGGGEEEIRCDIHIHSLDDCPPYEAMSYTWGDPYEGYSQRKGRTKAGDTRIKVGNCPLDIGESLYDALKWLRYPSCNATVRKDHGAFIDVNDKRDGVVRKDPDDVLSQYEGRSRLIWADRICINQSDWQEKSHQLKLMGDIYRKCAKGIIWLGEPTELTERAFVAAYWLCNVAYHQENLGDKHDLLNGSDGDPKSGQETPSFMTMILLDNVGVKWTICQCWKALMELTQRAWFTRAWVVQEATLPPDVRIDCGGYSIPWSELVRALNFVPSIPIRPLAGVPLPSHMAVVEKLRQEVPAGRSTLLNILLRNNNCDATVLVDRIYAFCGLVDESELQDLELRSFDYPEQNPEWSDEERKLKSEMMYRKVCKKLSVNILRRSENLDLLSGPVGNVEEGRHDWPSWIPDWAASHRPNCLLLDQHHFRASKDTRTTGSIEFQRQDTVMGVEGFVFDRIEEVSDTADRRPPNTWTFQHYRQYKKRMETMVEFLQCCLKWEDITKARVKAKYVGGGDMLDAYWQTLLAGHVTPENHEIQKKQFQRFDMISKDGAKILQSWRLPAWPWILFLTPHNLAVLLVRAMVTKRDFSGLLRIGDFTSNPNFSYVRNRHVIRTSMGYIGLSPASARKGDAVTLCKGAKVPLVAREAKDLQGHWSLVGEAYIHGIMSGCVWDEKRCAKMWFA
ncbi:hypothetical protein BO83DRAFT_457154 [Aspergillus eucalypticola CBS 122712]|uniref:Heterokaryon incompatibility domain-containing protein n=1 Tax=Aspergillus eucalypticola (strain CBS 122712 / IBT 29274) TaxID=1448314 RepID=A0A317USR9_ASPEC|nr:uncharacterized protein BO83DRAFT_457154 [Aspergillus eucalypticola CBS 122712]PWY63130.1 hypothetical protein BO83DRAFT_457154 [Aspergillus eucalypticola CBS 122712]